jgi:hypothetical protein
LAWLHVGDLLLLKLVQVVVQLLAQVQHPPHIISQLAPVLPNHGSNSMVIKVPRRLRLGPCLLHWT